MSHFVKIQTEIREQEHLTRALCDLNIQYKEGKQLLVRGYLDDHERAQVVVNTKSQYDIGFQRKDELFEVVADWSEIQRKTPLRMESFVGQVCRQYAYNIIHDQAHEQNLIIEDEQHLKNGDTVIILSERS